MEAQGAALEWQEEQVADWQRVYDESYKQAPTAEDPTFDVATWQSSYTGQPIPQEEMREWVDQTVERINVRRPRRVLEIGCGTGLLLLRIAPACTHYLGTDFSPHVLHNLHEQVMRRELSQVSLRLQQAADFTGIEAGAYDAVIINSVVQYFPSIDYLLRVLEGAVRALAPGGFIFVGDVRNYALLEAFHTSVQLYQAPSSLSRVELQQRVHRHLAEEEELVVDPAFFTALTRQLPQLSHAEIHLKRGRHHNELTRFRYDVILHVGATLAPLEGIDWLNWQQELSVPAIRQRLHDTQPAVLGIARVPNARLLPATRAVELLASPEGP
jgi:ubiquinone/menaquinone biosynthesis C-methylase UbiE